MKVRLIVALYVLCLSLMPVHAIHDAKLRFSRLNIEHGLSQNTVFGITQDHYGNMWFTTFDGVNKYNGYDFEVFHHITNDSTSIACNVGRSIITDRKGRVWIGTDKSLSLYNQSNNTFTNFVYGTEKPTRIKRIIELTDSTLLASADSRLVVFNTVKQQFDKTFLPVEMGQFSVSALYKQDETIYIGTKKGNLYTYSINDNKLKRIKEYKSKVPVQCIIQSDMLKLWVASEGDGLFCIDLKTSKVHNYRHTYKPGSISSNYIRSLAFDGNDQLWIGTFNDLNIYNEHSDSFITYNNSPTDKESISQRSIRCIFKDNQGGMWLGTYFGGLNYYHPLKARFRNIQEIPYENSLNDNIVSCIEEDKDGSMWIGTNSGGVNYFDPRKHDFKHYKLNINSIQNKPESNDIKSIYIDDTTRLVYVGAHAGGISIIKPGVGVIEHYNISEKGLVGDVYSIAEFRNNLLWLGTLDGLYTFNKSTKAVKKIHRDANGINLMPLFISKVFEDSRQMLWIGAENGLQIYSIKDNNIVKYNLDNERLNHLTNIQDISETSDKKILISTRNGLYKYDHENNSLVHFNTNNGLPNDVVHGVEEDSYGRLWISTNHGLCRYDHENNTFRNFTVNDGIQSNEFNNYSHCRAKSGRLYFGGVNGITTFLPETLIDNPYTPSPRLTNLYLFNKQVKANDETGILKQSITNTREITMNNEQNSFTLEFVVSNYISGKHNFFAYTLKGHDEEWFVTENERKVSYSNLRPGKYTFMVKAANSDGIWNEEPLKLDITVLPIWFETWWARLLFFISFVMLITFILRHFWIRKNMETELELEKKDKEHQEEISQMKMRFFINISHELRTPLTLITAPLQDVISRTTDKWTKTQLKYVERNAQRLLHLVNQLMDYRRADLGVFRLRVCHDDINQPMKEIYSYYEKLANKKQIKYSFVSNVENISVYADRQYMELILNNLLSNAFKYTDTGSISVKVSADANNLILEVSDTGSGIPKNKQQRIFERFYQGNNEHIGSGIGLSLVQRLVELHHGRIELESEEGKGSKFTIYIPQGADRYKKEELYSNASQNEEESAHSTNIKEMYYIEEEKQEEEPEDKSAKKGTLLLVEDNKDVLDYISDGLKHQFSVIKAANGEEALGKIKDKEVDMVICDIVMPVMNGIKLCKHLKQNLSTSHIPVIMLSAQTDTETQIEALKIGADDYMMKPFSLTVLTKKIQNMFRTRQRMLEHASNSIEVEPEKITFNPLDEELLKRAIEVVKRNIDNTDFSAEDFASEMFMSRSNLHLKLKAITGESAIEFIKKIRFGEACRLIKEGKHSISEISTMVGFNTPSYFATSFKKYIGCLPTEYMKKNN